MSDDTLSLRYEVALSAFKAGDTQKALTECNDILSLDSNHLDTLHLASTLHFQSGAHGRALEFAKRAISVAPDSALHHNALGLLLAADGEHAKALLSFDTAMTLQSDWADVYVNRAAVLLQQDQLQESLNSLNTALELDPKNTNALVTKCAILTKAGLIKEALACVDTACSIAPNAQKLSRIRLGLLSYSYEHGSQDTFTEILRMWRLAGSGANAADIRIHHQSEYQAEKSPIRIGYVSADFRMHSVGQLIEPVLATHDTSKFRIFLYSNHKHVDGLTNRLTSYGHEWRQITDLPDRQVAQMVQDDNIDILVDLSVHTEGERLGVFKLKPAPLQMTWMGYVTTTGLEQIDHIISDNHVLPKGDEKYFVEKPLRLPNMHFCYQPTDIPTGVTQSDPRNGPITFGSLNNVKKMNERVIEVWSKIMNAIPNSRLTLKTRTLSNPIATSFIKTTFHHFGVNPDRLTLVGESSREEHLATYNSIDIALDPFPYNGTMTTLETLWMGVPVISLNGDRWSSRVGAGILSTIGLTQLIARSEQEYIDIAVELARSQSKLKALQRSTRVALQASPICNPRAFTRALEVLYIDSWTNWCNG